MRFNSPSFIKLITVQQGYLKQLHAKLYQKLIINTENTGRNFSGLKQYINATEPIFT